MIQKQFILIDGQYPDDILQSEHKQFGLWLTRASADASIINLIYRGSAVASFPASTVTIAEIRAAADKVLAQIKMEGETQDGIHNTLDNQRQDFYRSG